MERVSDIIKAFFEDFEHASNTFEHDLLARQFSDPFMSADPSGNIQVVKQDDFLAGITKRQTFFHSIGFQFVKTLPFEESWLDNHYVLVKVHGTMRFEKEPGQPVDIFSDSHYILFVKDGLPKIVFSLTHENLLQIMQKHGLIAG